MMNDQKTQGATSPADRVSALREAFHTEKKVFYDNPAALKRIRDEVVALRESVGEGAPSVGSGETATLTKEYDAFLESLGLCPDALIPGTEYITERAVFEYLAAGCATVNGDVRMRALIQAGETAKDAGNRDAVLAVLLSEKWKAIKPEVKREQDLIAAFSEKADLAAQAFSEAIGTGAPERTHLLGAVRAMSELRDLWLGEEMLSSASYLGVKRGDVTTAWDRAIEKRNETFRALGLETEKPLSAPESAHGATEADLAERILLGGEENKADALIAVLKDGKDRLGGRSETVVAEIYDDAFAALLSPVREAEARFHEIAEETHAALARTDALRTDPGAVRGLTTKIGEAVSLFFGEILSAEGISEGEKRENRESYVAFAADRAAVLRALALNVTEVSDPEAKRKSDDFLAVMKRYDESVADAERFSDFFAQPAVGAGASGFATAFRAAKSGELVLRTVNVPTDTAKGTFSTFVSSVRRLRFAGLVGDAPFDRTEFAEEVYYAYLSANEPERFSKETFFAAQSEKVHRYLDVERLYRERGSLLGESAHDAEAAAKVAEGMQNQTVEGRRELVREWLTDVLSGKRVFSGQPEETMDALSFADRFDRLAGYLLDLITFAGHFDRAEENEDGYKTGYREVSDFGEIREAVLLDAFPEYREEVEEAHDAAVAKRGIVSDRLNIQLEGMTLTQAADENARRSGDGAEYLALEREMRAFDPILTDGETYDEEAATKLQDAALAYLVSMIRKTPYIDEMNKADRARVRTAIGIVRSLDPNFSFGPVSPELAAEVRRENDNRYFANRHDPKVLPITKADADLLSSLESRKMRFIANMRVAFDNAAPERELGRNHRIFRRGSEAYRAFEGAARAFFASMAEEPFLNEEKAGALREATIAYLSEMTKDGALSEKVGSAEREQVNFAMKVMKIFSPEATLENFGETV